MKKLITLFLAVAIIASLGIATSALDYQGNGVIKMGTAVVDGQLDPAYTGSLYFTGLGTGENAHGPAWDYTAEASIYLMYDNDNLYIFAEVIDNDLFSKGPDYCMGSNPYLNDCIEFRLNFEGKGGDDSESRNHKVSIDAYGFSCFGLERSYSFIDYANLEYATEITDAGYNVEVAIPCSRGSTNMIKAGKLGFTYQLNDINASGAHKRFTSSFVGEPVKNCVFYNLSTEKAVAGQGGAVTPTSSADTTTQKQEDTTPKVDDTTPKVDDTTSGNDNPATFDPFVIAVTLTAASGAAFVVASKKKH